MTSAAIQRLVAGDVMQRDVLTIAPDDTLRDALGVMTENHVTGLPVMDARCRCIGLVTATDILNYEQDHAEDPEDHELVQHFNPDIQQWESVPVSRFGLEEFGDVRVDEVMTRDLIWVDRDQSLQEVANRMLDAKIHRVLVMDDDCQLFGIISAYDFVRVMAGR